MTLNICFNHIRRERFEKCRDLDTDVEQLGASVAFEAKFDMRVMLDYASTFKAIDRQLIYLYLIGHEQDSIADIMDLTVDNVSTKISRLKKKLTTYLNKGAEHE